jgi:KaiC/GvpD/RAD55 family RecA-like ATPase
MSSATVALDPDALPPGTNVLVSGPVMTAKQRLVLRLLAGSDAADRGTVVATTRTGADSIARAFRTLADDIPDDRFAVVDCTGVPAEAPRSRRAENRRYVSNPGDLTGIGIGLTEFMRAFYHRGDDARVGVHSLSTMLMYTEFRRLFRFLHVVTARIDSSGFVGVFAVDDSALTEREGRLLLQLFDSVVETREGEGKGGTGTELRVRGADAGRLGPAAWTRFAG